MSTRRACRGTTRAGNPCRAPPLTATGATKYQLPAKDHDWCAAHHPDIPESSRFGSHAQATEAGQQGGRPAVPRTTEVLRKLVNDNALVLARPHFLTLGYDVRLGDDGEPYLVEVEGGGAKLYGTAKSGRVVVSEHNDLGAMMTAVEQLMNRVNGKPKQATEISGPEGGPVEVVAPLDARTKSAKALALLQQLGQFPDAGDH